MSMIGSTPEFVRWAIAQSCPLREFENWQSPEQVERRLRPLRTYGEAVEEGREFEGICVSPSASASPGSLGDAKGFRSNEVLEAYGGRQFVGELCRGCPVNALRRVQREPLAGCFGLFEFSGLVSFHDDLELAANETDLRRSLAAEFPMTTPRWYGLWIESPPRPAQLELLGRLFTGLGLVSDLYRERLGPFLTAVDIALETSAALHLTLVPRGDYTATQWTLVSHCKRCRAPWPDGSRRCVACGLVGRPEPSKRRKARGERPYWRLAGFLGPANVEPFLQRYFDSRNSQS